MRVSGEQLAGRAGGPLAHHAHVAAVVKPLPQRHAVPVCRGAVAGQWDGAAWAGQGSRGAVARAGGGEWRGCRLARGRACRCDCAPPTWCPPGRCAPACSAPPAAGVGREAGRREAWRWRVECKPAAPSHLDHGRVPVLVDVAHDLDGHVVLVLAVPALQHAPERACGKWACLVGGQTGRPCTHSSQHAARHAPSPILLRILSACRGRDRGRGSGPVSWRGAARMAPAPMQALQLPAAASATHILRSGSRPAGTRSGPPARPGRAHGDDAAGGVAAGPRAPPRAPAAARRAPWPAPHTLSSGLRGGEGLSGTTNEEVQVAGGMPGRSTCCCPSFAAFARLERTGPACVQRGRGRGVVRTRRPGRSPDYCSNASGGHHLGTAVALGGGAGRAVQHGRSQGGRAAAHGALHQLRDGQHAVPLQAKRTGPAA